MRVLFCVVLLTFGAVVKAQKDYQEYWQNDYANYDNYNDMLEDNNDDTEVKPKTTQAELLEVPIPTEVPTEPERDKFEDYQIEDNRSESTEKQVEENKEITAEETALEEQVEENKEATAGETAPKEDAASQEAEEHRVLPLEAPEESDENEDYKQLGLDDDAWGEAIDDAIAPLPVPKTEDNNNEDIVDEPLDILSKGQDYLDNLNKNLAGDDKDMDKIIEETNNLLAESEDAFDDYDNSDEEEKNDDEDVGEFNDEDTPDKVYKDLNADNLNQDLAGDDKDMDKIIEETNDLLAESHDAFDPDNYDNSDEEEKNDNEDVGEFNDEDTPDKVYKDLNADIAKLFETLDKLGDDTSDENEKKIEEVKDDVKDYEEKYNKPYNEGVALSWRNAEVDAAEPEDSQQNDDTADGNDEEIADENIVSAEEGADDDYEVVEDSNLSKIFADIANASNEKTDNFKQKEEVIDLGLNNEEDVKEKTGVILEKFDEIKDAIDYADNYGDPSDREPNADDDIDSVINQIFANDVKEPQLYGDDALVDEKQPKEENAEEFETKTTNVEEENTVRSVMVDDLNSAELSDLMMQFAAAHQDDIDVNSENFAKHVKPVHITLSVDEPTVVTSPDYPDTYPRNNIIDWIFEGPGTGIEFNITDLDVNGALGEYLLIKPGGLDESGKEGLIFSHHLNSARNYRFTDVNRMFVRFESKENSWSKRGFSFSVKLIWPQPTYEEEPETAPLANPPQETLTLNLAGLTLPKFHEIQDTFLELLADMAKEYVKDNNIALGMNTTSEVTQITRTAICNIQWPEYENCVEVTFGVPLHYEEEPEQPRLTAEELDDMWTSYIVKEEFSERLRSMGITEYAIPNDRTVLMVWLVIAAGVLISMAMLAFALWRFSCFEDYTRMQAYGDADSIQNEKRVLDLYPTPHQTLPPLYCENDYKWADDKYDDSTRVDMGGFANRSYIRDDHYDIDSDDDVTSPRDRKGAISPRNLYDA